MSGALTSCTKGLFLLFNFVFWLTGLGLLVVGILSKYAFSYLLKLSSDINYNLAPYIMIGCGVFVVLVGFIGCWAAVKEHGWALKMYMFILVLLVVVEVGGAIAGYVMRGKLSDGLKKGLTNAVKNYYTNEELKTAMDKVQSSYIECCGVDSYKDYSYVNSTAGGNNTAGGDNTSFNQYKVPKTCCKDGKIDGCKFDQLINDNTTDTGFYNEGCYEELLIKTKAKFVIFGGTALGIAVFQIMGIVFAYCLTKQFNSNYEIM